MADVATITPSDETELASAISGATGPLSISGGGTLAVSAREVTQSLSARKLCGVELYEPGALTLVAQAGTPVHEIEALLANETQRLAFEPADMRGLLGTDGAPTIGGMVAANMSGPRRIQVGACRDFLLGVRFVDGQGHVISNGGRVMKNVTGYDLSKLMAGSWGTLGVLSQVSLKVLPQTETNATLILEGLSDIAAVRVMSAALGSPYDVAGAAHFSGANPRTVIRLEGFEKSVRYRSQTLREHISEFGETQIEQDAKQSADIWKQVREVSPFHGELGDVWRISVRPTDGPDVAARLGADGLLYDWGGGLIWALTPPGTDVRQRIGDTKGHATLIRAGQESRDTIPMFQPEPVPVAAISAGIRARFDPRSILNPGLME